MLDRSERQALFNKLCLDLWGLYIMENNLPINYKLTKHKAKDMIARCYIRFPEFNNKEIIDAEAIDWLSRHRTYKPEA